jgi:hypothetical protein
MTKQATDPAALLDEVTAATIAIDDARLRLRRAVLAAKVPHGPHGLQAILNTLAAAGRPVSRKTVYDWITGAELAGRDRPGRAVVADAIRRLDAIDADRDPEAAHTAADQVLLDSLSPTVRDAYARVVARASWW